MNPYRETDAQKITRLERQLKHQKRRAARANEARSIAEQTAWEQRKEKAVFKFRLRHLERHIASHATTGVPAHGHQYLSMYCYHGTHYQCRMTCKTCHAKCTCECHRQATTDE